MFEVADFRDEPLTGWTNDPTDYGYTHHIYTKDLVRIFDLFFYDITDYCNNIIMYLVCIPSA